MNVKRENEPAIVIAVAALLKARRAIGVARDRMREFDNSGRTTSGVIVQLRGNGPGEPRLTLASTNEVRAALKMIDDEHGEDHVVRVDSPSEGNDGGAVR